jgi:hypothetical protein
MRCGERSLAHSWAVDSSARPIHDESAPRTHWAARAIHRPVQLPESLDQRSWNGEAGHRAYLYWRRRDPSGPRVAGAAWDREVAAVNRFYRWALRKGHVVVNPIPQVSRRPALLGAGWAHRSISLARHAQPCRPAGSNQTTSHMWPSGSQKVRLCMSCVSG